MTIQDAICTFMNESPGDTFHSFTQLMAVTNEKGLLVGYQPSKNKIRYMVVENASPVQSLAYVAIDKFGKRWRTDQSIETKGHYVLFNHSDDRLEWLKGDLA